MLDSEHNGNLCPRVCCSSPVTDPQKNLVTKKFTCETCGQDFRDNSTLDHHVEETHFEERDYFECGHCGKTFTLKENLVAHMELKHVNTKPETIKPAAFCCHLCNRSFGLKNKLTLHIRRVHSGRRFKCTVCGKKLARSDGLKRHMRLEHLAPAQAAACSPASDSDSAPAAAQLLTPPHTEFSCLSCGKVFKKKSNRDRHTKFSCPKLMAEAVCNRDETVNQN